MESSFKGFWESSALCVKAGHSGGGVLWYSELLAWLVVKSVVVRSWDVHLNSLVLVAPGPLRLLSVKLSIVPKLNIIRNNSFSLGFDPIMNPALSLLFKVV